jgi:bifunctional DNase/RNase
MSDSESAIPVEIKGLMLDPSSNLPIVVLKDPVSERFLPIWIGVFEAQAIALKLEGIVSPRPMTHDLLHQSLDQLRTRVARVVISDLRENTFFAEIHLRTENEEGRVIIDARPSDAIALALRAEAPVFVAPTVLDKAQSGPLSETLGDEDRLRKWLEEADPESFGKYEM